MTPKLFLGVAREDITPKVGARIHGYSPDQYSEFVRDPLSVTAFAFECGRKRAMLISATVCEIDTDMLSGLRKTIGEENGVSSDAIIISATHTHSGPTLAGFPGWGDIDWDYYNEIFRPQILTAAEKAWNALQPVVMGVGSGTSLVGINRRELTKENQIILGQSPWGCFNPEMTVISFKNAEGKTVANIVHYGAHGTCAGVTPAISRDWSGHMIDALDSVSGGITAFFNGPEGDVGPRLSNGCTTGDLSSIEEIGRIAAADAVRIYGTIREYGDADVDFSSASIDLPLKARTSYEDAVEKCEEMKSEVSNLGLHMLTYYRKIKSSYENGYPEASSRSFEQTIVRLGNIAFPAFPYEVFSEIGMRIDQAEPDLKVLSLAVSNGTYGYFPTQDQLCRGGYEIDWFLYSQVQAFTEDADYRLMCLTLDHLQKVKSSK